MKNQIHFNFHGFLLFLSLTFVYSCNAQSDQKTTNGGTSKIMIPKNGLNSGFLDSKGNLWFGTNGNGVYHYNGASFQNFTKANGLHTNQIYSIVEDNEKNIWFGTQNGLSKYDGIRFTHVPIPFQDTNGLFLDKVYPIINPNAVHSLAFDKEGTLWIGTAGGGAYSYDGNTFMSFLSEIGTKQEDSLYHNWIPSIAIDTGGTIWFASMTHGGVNSYNGKSFTQIMPKDGLSDDMVRTIYNDKSGEIWFGFNGNRESGLTVYDGNSFKTFSLEDGLCNQRIRAIYEDKNGLLWLGSNLGNVCTFDGENFSEFSIDGQKIYDILFITGDSEDKIWFGGKNGLWRFDGETLIDFYE